MTTKATELLLPRIVYGITSERNHVAGEKQPGKQLVEPFLTVKLYSAPSNFGTRIGSDRHGLAVFTYHCQGLQTLFRSKQIKRQLLVLPFPKNVKMSATPYVHASSGWHERARSL